MDAFFESPCSCLCPGVLVRQAVSEILESAMFFEIKLGCMVRHVEKLRCHSNGTGRFCQPFFFNTKVSQHGLFIEGSINFQNKISFSLYSDNINMCCL